MMQGGANECMSFLNLFLLAGFFPHSQKPKERSV